MSNHSPGHGDPPYRVVPSISQVLAPVIATFMEELGIFLTADALRARRATVGHAPGNKSDPEGYSTFNATRTFITEVFGGKGSGGDSDRNKIVRDK